MNEEMREWLRNRLPICNCELPKAGEITMARPAMVLTERGTFTCPWCEIEVSPQAASAKLNDMSMDKLHSITVNKRLRLINLRKKQPL